MDPNISRGARSPREPDPYLRRRVLVFGGGLGLLGLLAWACSTAAGVARTPPTGPAATLRRAADSAAATAAPTLTAVARPARTTGVTVRAHGPSHACAPSDVIISLFVSQQIYRHPANPQFTIYVVNTGRTACTFDAGPRSLQLVIKSGLVHVWSRAGCAHGAAARIVRLPHSVPLVTYLKWNRERSSPGCPSPRDPAPPGTYAATVTSGADHSQTEVFALR
jgi:hypothetical protein